ncbi:MAG: TetR/AcrR family transcriptional regulator [Desulfobulbaceae bacterium]|uniref:TetR/AcrR family transcriptional regulator n=1 Tax=Candidatus Desulfobia pelagia TaxID=2841692 RepID=A0A8J6NDW8_9BACT|nr:TetR/AcrR family transcriptional regulator [Candidatus Desulfobia pelagia]
MFGQIMVSKTFINLAEDKKKAVLQSAVREFARLGYQKASLNTIVRDASISKGSLYQYFQNKEALFHYIFEQFVFLVKRSVQGGGDVSSLHFFSKVRQVFWAGIHFVDYYPEYFQMYLKVLFEADVPGRENLLARVHLFSSEYFGPLCDEAREKGEIRDDIPAETVIFMIDALISSLLQGYALSYLDSGLELKRMDKKDISSQVDKVLLVLEKGLVKT